MPNYYDNWKKQRFTCRNCGWQGTGADCPQGESFRELFEINCPACGEHVAVVSYPTIEEAKHNWDKLSEGIVFLFRSWNRSNKILMLAG